MKKNDKPEVKAAPEKIVHTWGKWVERPRLTVTLVCACGNKYIKTRPKQTMCITCMSAAR